MEINLEKPKTLKVVEGDSNLYEDYQITKWIGKGLNMVYEVVEIKTEKVEAIKEIRLADANDYIVFKNEIVCLQKTKEHPHPSIINYIGYYITLDDRGEFNQYRNGYIHMEKGVTSLSFYVNKRAETKNYFSNEEVLKFISKIMDGHVHLQNLHIAHRDVKPENILIFNTEELDYKICDVGVSTVTGDSSNTKTRTLMGTLGFLSPELFSTYRASKMHTQYNPYKSDVFSLGLCFLFFCTFKKMSGAERLEKDDIYYQKRIREWIKESKFRYRRIAGLSKLLKKMLCFNENERPDFLELGEYLTQSNFYTLVDEKKINMEMPLTDLLEIKNIKDINMLEKIVETRPYSVRISLSNNKVTEDQMKLIGEELSKHRSLRKLFIELELCEIKENHVKYLESALINHPKLEECTLNFWNNFLREDGGKTVFAALKQIQHVRELNLNISVNDILDKGFIDIDQKLNGCFANLTTLTLDFSINKIWEEKGLISLAKLFTSLKNVIHLDLNFESNGMRNKGVSIVCQSLKHMTLKSLSLNFASNDVQDQGLFDVQDLVDKLKDLNSLSVLIWSNQIKDKSFKALCKTLQNLTKLEKLHIIAFKNNLKEGVCEALGEAVFALKDSIVQLAINLSGNSVSNAGVKTMMVGIRRATQINHLKIFLENTSITSECLGEYSRTIGALTKLTYLNMSLKSNYGFAPKEFEPFVEVLTKLEFLSYFSLNLEGLNIGDEICMSMARAIQQLNLISYINLNLSDCNIFQNGLLQVISSLSSLVNLQEVYLNFKGNQINQKSFEIYKKAMDASFMHIKNDLKLA